MITANILVGALIGIAMSVPVGPSGIIGVKRIISRGMMAGVASGFGIAIADMLFATLAVAGISWVSEFMTRNQYQIQFIGAFIVMLVGLWGLKKGPVLPSEKRKNRSLAAAKDFTTMLAITLANPQTIIGFSTSFAATVAFYSVDTNEQIAALVGGIFAGSLCMWVFLSWFVSRWRGEMEEQLITKLHHYASLFVVFVGLCLLLYAVILGDVLNFG